MKNLLVLAAFCLLLLPAAAGALTIQPGQATLEVTAEQGSNTTLFMVFNNPAGEKLTYDGGASPWMRIEGGETFTLPSGGISIVEVEIRVPGGLEVGDYRGRILADGTEISSIFLTVTLPTEEIEKLMALADVNEEVGSMIEVLRSDVESYLDEHLDRVDSRLEEMENGLASSISEVKDYHESVEELQSTKDVLESQVEGLRSEMASLEDRTNSLQAQNAELEVTGNSLRAESPILFVIGLIGGAGGMYVFRRRLGKYF